MQLCGCEGQPRCRIGQWSALEARGIVVLHQLVSIFQGRIEGYLAREVGCKIEGYYPESATLTLPNGNLLKAISGGGIYQGVSRICEVDKQGRTVWEAAFRDRIVGLIAWPLVRVGFSRADATVEDLDTKTARWRALRHADPVVRLLAAQTLAKLPRDSAIYHRAIECLEDRDDRVRGEIVALLVTAGPNAKAGIASLARLLDDPNPRIRGDAGDVLSGIGSDAVPALVKAFENKQEPDASGRRWRAIRALAHMVPTSDPQVHSVLKAAFVDHDPKVRKWICYGLNDRGEHAKPYLAELVKLFDDPDEDVARTATYDIRRLGNSGKEAVPGLLQALKRPALRGSAIISLAEVERDNPDVLGILSQYANHEQPPEICYVVVKALESYRDDKDGDKVIPILEILLRDDRIFPGSGEPVRLEAIHAIGEFGKRASAVCQR